MSGNQNNNKSNSNDKNVSKAKTNVRVRTNLMAGGPVLQHGVRVRQASR